MIAAASEQGICLLEFSDRDILSSQMEQLSVFLGVPPVEGESPFFEQLKTELQEYFGGSRKTFEVPLQLTGTDFQKGVWEELLKIPFGSTRSYMQQAIALKNPDAIRAVAGANGANHIAIIVPCHRVIGADGSLTGYGGGIRRKKWLLEHEGKYKQTELAFDQ